MYGLVVTCTTQSSFSTLLQQLVTTYASISKNETYHSRAIKINCY